MDEKGHKKNFTRAKCVRLATRVQRVPKEALARSQQLSISNNSSVPQTVQKTAVSVAADVANSIPQESTGGVPAESTSSTVNKNQAALAGSCQTHAHQKAKMAGSVNYSGVKHGSARVRKIKLRVQWKEQDTVHTVQEVAEQYRQYK
jgi:ubiquinone biosynthesis protein UbiJ